MANFTFAAALTMAAFSGGTSDTICHDTAANQIRVENPKVDEIYWSGIAVAINSRLAGREADNYSSTDGEVIRLKNGATHPTNNIVYISWPGGNIRNIVDLPACETIEEKVTPIAEEKVTPIAEEKVTPIAEEKALPATGNNSAEIAAFALALIFTGTICLYASKEKSDNHSLVKSRNLRKAVTAK